MSLTRRRAEKTPCRKHGSSSDHDRMPAGGADGDLAASLRALKLCSSNTRLQRKSVERPIRRDELRDLNVGRQPQNPQAGPTSMSGRTAHEVSREGSEQQRACRHCSRTFRADALARHESVCQKVFMKSRPRFNSKGQRKVTDGSFDGMRACPTTTANKSRSSASSRRSRSVDDIAVGQRKKVGKTADWKKKSTQLRHALSAMRGQGSTGPSYSSYSMDGVPSFTPEDIDDRRQCPYCNRKFNSTAFPKHRDFCKEQALRKKITSRPPHRSLKR